MFNKKFIIFIGISVIMVAFSQQYEVPPSSSTYSNVPVISDRAMKQCVILYNKAKWLAEELELQQVDRYDRSAVDAYNNKINQHSQMINNFNQNCAGRQSQSAYDAAKKLNEQKP